MLTCLDPRGALSGTDQVGQGIPVTLLRSVLLSGGEGRHPTPVSATGEEQKGAQSLEEMLVGPGWFLGVALSHLPLLCAFPHPPPRSDSHTLLVSVIPPTTGPLHMLFTFFFDQQYIFLINK